MRGLEFREEVDQIRTAVAVIPSIPTADLTGAPLSRLGADLRGSSVTQASRGAQGGSTGGSPEVRAGPVTHSGPGQRLLCAPRATPDHDKAEAKKCQRLDSPSTRPQRPPRKRGWEPSHQEAGSKPEAKAEKVSPQAHTVLFTPSSSPCLVASTTCMTDGERSRHRTRGAGLSHGLLCRIRSEAWK